PIVAIVIAILMSLLGIFTLTGLSFEQYPFLAPPTIRITATYPGASAVAVEQSVATPIEQEVNGVEGMLYMQSSNTSDGRMLLDLMLRMPCIGQVDLFGGTDYGMRIWMRPDKLAKLGLTTSDVISSIKEQNLQAPAGRIGMAPSPKDQQFTYTVSAPGRLVTTDEFEDIIVRGSESAAQVRIRDIGRAELGSQDYNAFGRLDGKPAGAMAVYLLPGANQLKAAEAIYEAMKHAKGLFPPDMDYKIVYDTT